MKLSFEPPEHMCLFSEPKNFRKDFQTKPGGNGSIFQENFRFCVKVELSHTLVELHSFLCELHPVFQCILEFPRYFYIIPIFEICVSKGSSNINWGPFISVSREAFSSQSTPDLKSQAHRVFTRWYSLKGNTSLHCHRTYSFFGYFYKSH